MSEHSSFSTRVFEKTTVPHGRVDGFAKTTAVAKPSFTWWGERRPSD